MAGLSQQMGRLPTYNEVDDGGVALDDARDVQQARQCVDDVQKHLGGLGGGSDAGALQGRGGGACECVWGEGKG
jgi:hypothetical protein